MSADQRSRFEIETRNLRDENSNLQQRLSIAQTALRLSQDARAPDAKSDVREAREAFLRGDTREAEALRRKREQTLAAEGRERLAEAASVARERGALVLGRDTRAAVEAYRQATDYEPSNSDNWQQLGDLLVLSGNLNEATRAYTHFMDLSLDKTTRDPANTQWQRDLVISRFSLLSRSRHSGDALPSTGVVNTGTA